MKKIGIVTIFSYYNYGNRLQMYATQKVYEKFGFYSEVIRVKEGSYKEPLITRLKIAVKFLLQFKHNLKRQYLERLRINNGRTHSIGLFNESKEVIDSREIADSFHEQYCFVSVGSDQIWGWFYHVAPKFVFLRFAPAEKRIAFSPSFGSDSLDTDYHEIFAKGIRGIEYVSVREESGAKIVKELTGRDVPVLCDPTMCLSKEEWLAFAQKHRKAPHRKYILTYFLGPRPEMVNEILNKYNDEYEVVHLNSYNDPAYYAVNSSEWVDYINDASLFLTDSFHGVAFAVIMQTPFSVYGRIGGESMQTRITNILEKFALSERYDIKSNDGSLFDVDFLPTEKILVKEREKTVTFLKGAMGIES